MCPVCVVHVRFSRAKSICNINFIYLYKKKKKNLGNLASEAYCDQNSDLETYISNENALEYTEKERKKK